MEKSNKSVNSGHLLFPAAIAGAVFGGLLTLFFLALLNGGTLQYLPHEEISIVQAKLDGVETNVESINTNLGIGLETKQLQIDILNQQVQELEAQIDLLHEMLQE
ncbi:MAG: hypothetical protein QG639_1044 [Patescibacteria group bacterium]|nr:hypothetical protein [Patescibacteria group bacterium]